MCTHVYLSSEIYVSIHTIYVYIYIYTCIHVYIYTYVFLYIYIYVYVYIHLCTCTCISIVWSATSNNSLQGHVHSQPHLSCAKTKNGNMITVWNKTSNNWSQGHVHSPPTCFPWAKIKYNNNNITVWMRQAKFICKDTWIPCRISLLCYFFPCHHLSRVWACGYIKMCAFKQHPQAVHIYCHISKIEISLKKLSFSQSFRDHPHTVIGLWK